MNEYLIFVWPSDKKKYIADFKKDEVDSRNLRDSGTESDRTDARNCFYPFNVRDGKIVSIGEVPPNNFHPPSANVEQPDGSIQIWPMTDGGDEKKWRYARNSVARIIDKLEPKTGRSSVQIIFHKDMGTMRSVWSNAKYDSSEYGTKLVDKIIPGSGFTYPKSLWAVYDAVYAATSDDKDALVMDFFAGSGTTAHAVMQLNADDGGNRRFIMVQFPEAIDQDSDPYKAGYRNICEISRARISVAGDKIADRDPHADWKKDVGFRALFVDSTNFTQNFYQAEETAQSNLLDAVENVKTDRTDPEDLLFQVLVDWGVDLTFTISKREIEGKTVFFVSEEPYDLIACFDYGVTEELVKELARHEPARVVFRDNGFVSDAVKLNVEQIFKQLSPATDVKSI